MLLYWNIAGKNQLGLYSYALLRLMLFAEMIYFSILLTRIMGLTPKISNLFSKSGLVF